MALFWFCFQGGFLALAGTSLALEKKTNNYLFFGFFGLALVGTCWHLRFFGFIAICEKTKNKTGTWHLDQKKTKNRDFFVFFSVALLGTCWHLAGRTEIK